MGPKKLVAWLTTRHPLQNWPAPSTAARWLERYGLVDRGRIRRAVEPYTEPFAKVEEPNDLWCADFKGQFKTLDDKYCYPLTLTDGASRYLLMCRGMYKTKFEDVQPWFEKAFDEFGVPIAIRTDNGPPFASKAPLGLSRLSVWWRKLGITRERINPGHPEQNGRHERMHLTLKLETTRPPAKTLQGQQAKFDRFIDEFNEERPHEGP